MLSLPCFCVGSRTAAAARAFGFVEIHDAEGDGADLACAIGKACDPKKGALLHLCGREADAGARAELERSGFAVLAWVTYAAEAAGALSPATILALQEGRLDAILLFSPRTAATLKALMMRHGLKACCGSVIALGISEAVRAAVEDLPWRRLDAAAAPTEDAMLERLQKLLPVSGVP